MFSSVIYHKAESQYLEQTKSYLPKSEPIFQILIAKVLVFILIFVLAQFLPQIYAAFIVAILSGIQFWITKNMGRLYLHAAWSIDCSGEEDVWIYQANFEVPEKYEEVFWYSQLTYGACLAISFFIMLGYAKYSLVCAILIAFCANCVNFMAFSKIITLRNTGILKKIADEAGAVGEVRQTIKIPMMHRSKRIMMIESNYQVQYEGNDRYYQKQRKS